MPWFVSDRILLTTVFLGAVLAYYYVPAHLAHVAQITRVPEAPKNGPNKQLRVDAEEAIPLDTLRVLSDGYSHGIRVAAIKITANRVMNPRTKRLLLRDLAAKDSNKRNNAICAFRLLFYEPNLVDKSYLDQFVDYQSLKAIISALHNLLPEHTPGPENDSEKLRMPLSPVYPQYRPAQEALLMQILQDILTVSGLQSATDATNVLEMPLKAGLVSRWLAHYPFPCALPENARFGYVKTYVCRLLSGDIDGDAPWAIDDPWMAVIIQRLLDHDEGIEALRDAGLMLKEDGGLLYRDWNIEDVRMVNGESTAGVLTPPEMRELLDLAEDDNDDDGDDDDDDLGLATSRTNLENMRRRHREAIVVAEAGAPLRRENILQRQMSDNGTETTMFRNDRGTSRANGALQNQDAQLEQVIAMDEPMIMPEQPWDLRRQEIEGEAIVNESIRGAAGNTRISRNASIEHEGSSEDVARDN